MADMIPVVRLKSFKRKAPPIETNDRALVNDREFDNARKLSYDGDFTNVREFTSKRGYASDEKLDTDDHRYESQPVLNALAVEPDQAILQLPQFNDFMDLVPLDSVPPGVGPSNNSSIEEVDVPNTDFAYPDELRGLAILAVPFSGRILSAVRLNKRMSFMRNIVKHAISFREYHNRKRELLRNIARSLRKRFIDDSKLEERIKERDEKQRMKALRENDMSAYTELVKKRKDDRLQFLLDQTDSLLSSLRDFVETQKAQAELFDEIAITTSRINDDSNEREKPLVDAKLPTLKMSADLSSSKTTTTRDYYKSAHQASEKFLVQPSLIVGGTMKPYQLVGLEWMVSLYNNKLSGILADEMGLGKTVQAISLLAHLIEKKENNGPFLVCVPLSTLSNWANEFKRWAPSISVVQYKGTPLQRKEIAKKSIATSDYNVLLTTYDYTMKDKGRLGAIKWQCVIVDEGHRLKNAQSKFTLIMGQFQSRYRLLLTGTPLQNSLPELWSLLNFLLPKIFGSAESFEAWFSQPFAAFKGGSVEAGGETVGLNAEEKLVIINRLHAILRPFLLRRLKSHVLTQLPQKVEYVLRCQLSAWQRLQYTQVQRFGAVATEPDSSLKTARGLQNLLMQLRKVCNHPFLMRNETLETFDSSEDPEWLWRSCGKMELLDRILPKLKAGGHRILIFSQMTRMLDILSDYLDDNHHSYLRLDGSTTAADREQRMELFNAENSPYFIFLLSTRAGGLGINLATADTVIIYDSDWNPTVDAQAMDRAHRIGQKKEVRVLRLLSVSPIEEAIHSRATEKSTMENLVITAGKFEGGGDEKDEERTKFLESIIREDLDTHRSEDDEDGERESVIPDAVSLNRLIGRGDDEFALFQKMDVDRLIRDRLVKKPFAAGADGTFRNLESVTCDSTNASQFASTSYAETQDEANLRKELIMGAEISHYTRSRLMSESEVPVWARLSTVDQNAIKARRSITANVATSIVFKDISSSTIHVVPEYGSSQDIAQLDATNTLKRSTRSRSIRRYVDNDEEFQE